MSAADAGSAGWPGHAGRRPVLAQPGTPSPWVVRHASQIPAGGPVLDVACGRGRHTRFLLGRGHPVTAIDRDTRSVEDLGADGRVEVIEWDLERGRPFPLAGRHFAAVVVTNYLYRPVLADLVAAVAEGGVLLYETYTRGQERLGRPSSPAFLLEPGELLEAVRGLLRVLAYEDVVDFRPAAVQRIVAMREATTSATAGRP
jgi:SAM-dependent methyltransferase